MSSSSQLGSSQLGRNRALSIGSGGLSSKGRPTNVQDLAMSQSTVLRYFDPCAATASMFLYAQGNSVVCCHHDTLTIERRFSRHADEVQLLAVDTQSEVGAGRLVVSYDAGQTAIVWDIMTGDEVARFASYEHLTVAAWMRNGNVAFGNTQGNIILFEPTTSEHLSARTIDQIAVTAMAPAADCRTFAIGYQNGSLLIATLQPRFTILHNLSTSRGPSPIVTLSWHASSSRQKSDMLAVQTHDGDLRVWSVSKSYNADDPAKVVRILKRSENLLPGPNWMGWSKNGRIIQYSDTETLSWDVRTKHVTYDSIPTYEPVRGLAVYGPGATLFTLGSNNTVQQFDLNTPSMMVANVQHPANLLPPSPPISLEEQDKGAAASASASESESVSIQISTEVSESDEDHMSPIARLVRGAGHVDEPYRAASPASSQSNISSVSQSSTSSKTPGRYQSSVLSRGLTEGTYISTGSSIRSSAVPGREVQEKDAFSVSSLSSVSMTSSQQRARHRPSRLRNEVLRSPDDSKVHDLFKFTRSRLSDVPYKRPPSMDNSLLTNDDLRRQMLSIIFGWNKDVEDLVRDEMSRHPGGAASRILLAKWLGDIEPDIMTTSSENMTSSDWMLLALSGIGGTASQHKLGRAYVQRLLENGDLHAAATIMIGMGDQNDAIEIYVSHKRFLEALILTCLFFPTVWERQSQIIKKWGEWAVQHGQQQLAIRCFACTDKESSEPWTSPSAAQVSFQNITATIPEILSPPLSPPGLNRGPQRSVAKNSALKLITSFGDQGSKSKFFSGAEDGQTPIAAGVTPIAESALSPGGAFPDPATALLRPSQRSAFNTPNSARPPPGAFTRQRLPSIGEAPADSPRHPLKSKAAISPAPPVNAVPSRKKSDSPRPPTDDNLSVGLGLARASTASPMMMRDSHRRKDPPPPSPSPQSLAVLMEGPAQKNGPRKRIPDGLDLHLQNIENQPAELTSPEQSISSSTRFHWPTRRRGPGSVASSVTSASSVARSHRGHRGEQGHQASAKTLDDYIHSLDAASHSKARHRTSSREGRKSGRDGRDNSRKSSRERSQDRGRATSRGLPPKGPKRSPTSPIPMSPEDLINLSTPKVAETRLDDEGMPQIDIGSGEPATVKKRERSKPRAVGSRTSSRGSRAKSPDRRPPALDLRGRSKGREGSIVKSPSSPVPMSAGAQQLAGSEDEEDLKRALEAQEKFRIRASRSSNRSHKDPASPISVRARDMSAGRTTAGHDKHEPRIRTPALPQQSATPGPVDDLNRMKEERQLKKEAAARELEERRKSLARRPLAPTIPHPDELSPAIVRSPMAFELPSTTYAPPRDLPPRSQTVEPQGTRSMYASRNGPQIGLPATPKAMRLILESDPRGASMPVPPIPATFAQASPPTSNHSSPNKVDSQVDALTLLPSTVYSPPPRPPIARSMSCPPEEGVLPKSLPGGSSSRARPHLRKLSTGDGQSGTMRTIEERRDVRASGRRASHDDQIPPPPPPPPMVIKELQHLASPPPPPPAPLPFSPGQKPVVYGGQTSGMIEIVMDDDQAAPPPHPQVPVAAPVSEATVPIIAAPAPPSSRNGHHRGRSSIDNSIAGRISRATERVRSISRPRTQSSLLINRTKSPEISAPAPYESIPMPPPLPTQVMGASFQARVDPRQQEFRTGLLESEMI